MNKQPQLLRFYFGSLPDTERLQIEKELLQDPEMLLDYLDLKRKVEGALEVPSSPSPFLWRRLQNQIQKRRWYFATVAGVAGVVAASVLCFYIFKSSSPNPVLSEDVILFDAASEHSFSSDVM